MTAQPAQPLTTDRWEQAIIDGLVRQLLEPRVIGHTTDSQGNTLPIMSTSPVTMLANDLWQTRQSQILAAVRERVDIDALATAIATKLATDLTARPTNSWARDSASEWYQKHIRGLVDDKVAAALAAEQLARLRAGTPAADDTTPDA